MIEGQADISAGFAGTDGVRLDIEDGQGRMIMRLEITAEQLGRIFSGCGQVKGVHFRFYGSPEGTP